MTFSKISASWWAILLGELCQVDRRLAPSSTPEFSDSPYVGMEHIKAQTGRILHSLGDRMKSAASRFDDRHVLYGRLSPSALLMVNGRDSKDFYDYLADVVRDADPQAHRQCADAFFAKNVKWLDSFPSDTAATVCAIIAVFADGGTEELETLEFFIADCVQKPGGPEALKKARRFREIMTEMKRRFFAG